MVPQSQKRRLILGAALLFSALSLSAQTPSGQADSLVRLLNARYLEQVEADGKMARKAIEPTFLHNGTYLSCDTALWHVEDKIINCFGNVQLLQGESVLTSGKLDYLIDENLAQFRGAVVELRNRQDNILRTRVLDYNTQDSLAVFRGGASMMSADGQIIESDEGTYSNARSLFTFSGNVNMFTDSVFVRTALLDYDSNTEQADFRSDIDFWKDGNMLSAGSGWYKRRDDTFFFRQRVHGLGETQESWSDSLYYYRTPNDLLMLGSVQVQDQSRKVAAMGDRLHYVDSLSHVTLDQRASAALWDGEGAHPDTTYLGASRFVYWTVPRCDIPEEDVTQAASRLEEMLGDPIAEYRRRAAEQARQAREEAERNDPLLQGQQAARQRGAQLAGNAPAKPGEAPVKPAKNGPDAPADTVSLAARDSSSFAVRDSSSFAVPRDTTKVGFLLSFGDVRIFRKDMQVRCDSLRYSDLDSIARLYKDPVVWNEGNRQYNSDSLFVLIRGNKMERANLLSNAFIHTEEPGGYFDQIKSTDVIAYFSDSTSLRRFDALGGVTALLYLEENGVIATANRTESKMMMATFDGEGNVDHVFNFDSPKSDAYPVAQLATADQKLRGFRWTPERRPKDKFDVTSMVVRDSERDAYEARPKTTFTQTDIYFPGHMKDVYASLERAKQKRAARQRGEETLRSAQGDTLGHPGLDTLGHPGLGVSGHPGLDPGSPADTLAVGDSGSAVGMTKEGAAVRDSSSFAGLTGDPSEARDGDRLGGKSPADTTYMSDRELKKALRIARRDARWAALDQRDADKAAAKAARKAERQARRAARLAARQKKQAAIDAAKLQKYIERYQKQKERHEGRKQKSVPAGERPPGTETGGEVPAPVESE